jgi:hypothetical protein
VAALSVVEGLLAGNLNILKASTSDTALALCLLAALGAADPTGLISERVIALRFPSSRREWLTTLSDQADAIAVRGGDDAVGVVRELAPPGCRVVAWGHRISFAYLTRDAAYDDALLDALAADVCRLEQQACSSPTTTTKCAPRPTDCSRRASTRPATGRPTCSTAAGCTAASSASSPSWSG